MSRIEKTICQIQQICQLKMFQKQFGTLFVYYKIENAKSSQKN